MEQLPAELLYTIFNELSQKRIKECTLVCKSWSFIARPYFYHTIRLYSRLQAKKFISALEENKYTTNTITNEQQPPSFSHSKVLSPPPPPPFGHFVKRIEGLDNSVFDLSQTEFMVIQIHCPFLEYIDFKFTPSVNRLPLWFQIKELQITNHHGVNTVALIRQWCKTRGSQLVRLNTDPAFIFCRLDQNTTTTTLNNNGTSITRVDILTVPNQFKYLYELELTDSSSTYTPLGFYLIKIIHEACPALTTLKIFSEYLLTSDIFSGKKYKLYDDTSNHKLQEEEKEVYIDEYSIKIMEKPPKYGHNLKQLAFIVHRHVATDLFDFLKLAYPHIHTLQLYFKLTHVPSSIWLTNEADQRHMDNISQKIYETITTGFTQLKKLEINLDTRRFLYNHLWPHNRIINWLDNMYDPNNNINNDNSNRNLAATENLRARKGNSSTTIKRLCLVKEFIINVEQPFDGIYHEKIYLGNGNWCQQLSALHISTHMSLPIILLNTLFHGKRNRTNGINGWQFMNSLTINTSVDKRIVLDIILYICPHLEHLSIYWATLKPSFVDSPRRLNRIVHHGLKTLELKLCRISDIEALNRNLALLPRLKRFVGKDLTFKQYHFGATMIPFPIHQVGYQVETFGFMEYFRARPLIHLNLPQARLDYVELSNIIYTSTTTNRRNCLIIKLMVNQLAHLATVYPFTGRQSLHPSSSPASPPPTHTTTTSNQSSDGYNNDAVIVHSTPPGDGSFVPLDDIVYDDFNQVTQWATGFQLYHICPNQLNYNIKTICHPSAYIKFTCAHADHVFWSKG
ncbi:hypothetical protein BJ944DRAFT_269904 [Cunninghamella echinulata]|nr:hypothetical protein BJ944DRAFT_269904 [Cunninghamella echinulata]